MKLWLRLTLTAALAVILCSGFGMVYKAAPQGRGAAPAPAEAQTGKRREGKYLKTPQSITLKELSVDVFPPAMVVRAAGLVYACADCHPGAVSKKADFVTDTLPKKKTARRMGKMVAAI